MRKATYGLAAICVLVFCLAVGVGGAFGDVAAPDCTDVPTGTPYLQTQYPSATPWATSTWVTPTSPPVETRVPEITPFSEPTPSITVGTSPTIEVDPTATETPGAKRDPRKTPTLVETLPVTGSGDNPRLGLALTMIGMVLFLGVAIVARGLRHAHR